MAIAVRHMVWAGLVPVACLAVAGNRLLAKPPADPCAARPEIHACAVFLQPEWIARRANAERTLAPPVSPRRVEAITVSANARVGF